MDVAGERRRIVVVRIGRFVHQAERGVFDGSAEAIDAPGRGRIAGGSVVVAADERDRERGMIGAPACHLVDGAIVHAALVVEEVAQDDDARRGGEFEGVRETVEVGAGGSRGNGDARVAERRGLAEMSVGEEEGAFARPERAAVGEQDQILGRERRGRAAEDLWVALELSPLGLGALLSMGTGLDFVLVGDASSSR